MENNFNNVSFKNAVALSAASIINLKTDKIDMTKNKLVLVTAAGTITGTPVLDVLDELDDVSNVDQFVMQLMIKNVLDSTEYINECILIKDATLRTANSTTNFKFLNVFTNDIIGISIGGD